MPYRIDRSNSSVLVIELQSPFVQSDFDGATGDMSQMLRTRTPYAMIADMRHIGDLEATMRRQSAQWLSTEKEALRQFCHGFCFVADSRLIRGVFTAIGWLAPFPVPVGAFSSMEEARHWAEGKLRTKIEASP